MRGALIGLVLALLAAAPAHAVESVFMDDDLLLHSGPEVADETLAELKALGVDRIRVTVNWAAVAPGLADTPMPGRLAPHDHLLRVARRMELPVLISVSGGSQPVRPSPAAFGRFVEALGERWDGEEGTPRVGAWSLWNEPNWGGLLQPQSVKVKAKGASRVRKGAKPRKRFRFVSRSPRIYRALHRAGAAALARTGHGADAILLGETAPRGAPTPGPTRALPPITFLADLLCLDRVTRKPLRGGRAREQGCSDFTRNGPLPATGFAHHPYGIRAAPGAVTRNPLDAGLADSARLTALLDAGAAHGRLAAGELPLWWTEFGYETLPDPRRGIDFDLHARWLSDAERIARQTPRVVAHTQFLMRDGKPDAAFPTTDARFWRTYQSGLRGADGQAKPGLAAYRLALSLPERIAPGAPLPVWGLLRPPADATGQKVTVEFAPEGSDTWAPLTELTVEAADGVLAETIPAPAATGRLRLSWQPPTPPAPPRDTSPAGALRPPPPAPPRPPVVRGHPVRLTLG